MANKIVKLSRRYETPGGQPFDHLELREPVYQDIFIDGLGVPAEMQPNGHGGSMAVIYHSVVDSYAQRLLVVPTYECISQLSPQDSLKLQDEILGFFSQRAASTT
jgi:hypothetical protein